MLARGRVPGISVTRSITHSGCALPLQRRRFSCEENRGPGRNAPFRFLSTGQRAAIIDIEEDSISWLLPGAIGLLLASMLFASLSEADAEEEKGLAEEVGRWKDGLPVFTAEEVAKHKTKSTGKYVSRAGSIWVTYKDGVYDITEFVDAHPGGDQKIMLAAGGSIEPFWTLYGQHRTAFVGELLESMRIGNYEKPKTLPSAPSLSSESLYQNEPQRHPALIVRSTMPFNAETPPALLGESLITPNELFYVRNHLPVPKVDPSTYVLEVEVEGRPPLRLTLEDLAKFPRHTVTATIQCAGNRRNEMNRVKAVRGGFWDIAEWTGVRLRDVLLRAGLEEGDARLRHVQFEGLDRDFEKNYGASIPIDKALSPDGDVILALQMNGQPLPMDHGYPVRVVAPGIVGARNVKWLSKVKASAEESPSHWQQKDYKGFNPSVDWHNVDWDSAPAIQELPVQSAITAPAAGAVLSPEAQEVEVKGYAWSGGGRGIVRVDVSADGGQTWTAANLVQIPQPRNRAWAWSLWNAKLPVPCRDCKFTLVAKAVDSQYNTQPERVEPIWNLRGVLSNAWHRVEVTVPPAPESRSDEASSSSPSRA